jgi:hypothetical protein
VVWQSMSVVAMLNHRGRLTTGSLQIEGPLVDEESWELEEGCGGGARPTFVTN